eukprot:TRINITY_DN157_c0_g1_i1.p1 TRINITY_DN157_c0_g1~~TRINITY_DN157_c0_g1_i1.p1  ORF type:complete len:181 (+),score=56.52 TRINITY_DN157_c0_g1_i1:159-701(+)
MRQLKYHEKKLLKKVDFLQWKDDTLRETKILRRYHVQNRGDYIAYQKVCGLIKKMSSQLQKLDAADEVRIRTTQLMLEKLYNMGIIDTKKSLVKCSNITPSAFCRRRLPVVMVRIKMAETLREAVTFIEQSHVRVGPNIVTDPAFIVTRNLEDYVTWVDSSKMRRAVDTYNDKLDDYDLL